MSYQRFSLLIDSKKRQIKTESPSNFTVNLTNSYAVKIARLKTGCIPLSSYNITSDNNLFSYNMLDASGVVHGFSFNIPNGKYNVSDLSTTLNQKLQQQPQPQYGLLSVSFNFATGLFTITETPGPDSMPLLYLNTVTFTLNTVPLSTFMGFIPSSPGAAISGINYVLSSNAPPEFVNTNYLKISLNNLSSGMLSIDNIQNNTTFFVELDNDYVSDYLGKNVLLLNYGDDSGGKNNVYTSPIHLQNFKVTLTDRDDKIVDLNGIDWWCVIELIIAVPIDKIIEEELQYIAPNFPTQPSYLISKEQQKKANQQNVNNMMPPWMRV
jgi:hypothetical protein